jgi:hypothetical protein
LIDEHVYKEDVDESTLEVKTDGAAKRLIKAKQGYKEHVVSEIPYPETNAQGVKRPRWKYVAKVVNTRTQRKKGRRLTSYTNNNMENTLVEEDGSLRVATVEEAKQVAWKPTRTKGAQYIYEGAQRAWLERTILGKTDVWGMAPKKSAAEAVLGPSAGSSKEEARAAGMQADIEESEVEVAVAAKSDEEDAVEETNTKDGVDAATNVTDSEPKSEAATEEESIAEDVPEHEAETKIPGKNSK